MIQRFIIVVIGILALLIIFSKEDVYGATIEGTGYHYFGPDITENHSCKLAELRAEEDAIIKGSGETVSAQDWKVCTDPDCVLTEYRWTILNGMIITSDVTDKTITELLVNRCVRSQLVQMLCQLKKILHLVQQYI